MSISGVSGSSYIASGAMRLHASGCGCAQCAAQRVESSPAPVDLQVGARKNGAVDGKQLTPEQQDQVRKLQARDREVRQHEQAHMAAAGGLAISAPSFSYQRGADGVNYAIGGEVGIDVSPGRSPQDTINKAQTIIHAALAPKDPSGADQAVASGARQMAQQAQQELASERSGDKGSDGQKNLETGANADQSNDRINSTARQAQSSYGATANPVPSLIKTYA